MAEERMQNMFMLGLISTSDEKRLFLDRTFFLQERLARILNMLKSFEQSKIFLNRVSKRDVPGYYEVVKNPMDLGTVQRKIGKYRSFGEFKADLDLIWSNCLEFNQEKYYRDCAVKMREVASVLETDMAAVSIDPEFLESSRVVSGRESHGPAVGAVLRRIAGKILLSAGYAFASRAALEVLCDVLRHRILEVIRSSGAEGSEG